MKCSSLRLVFALLLLAAIKPSYAQLPSLIPYVDGKKWGYADTNGKVVIAPQWESVDLFSFNRALVWTSVNGDRRRCVINTKGKYIIPPWRNWNGQFYKSWAGACYNACNKSGKWGIIDSNNKEVLPCMYDKTDGQKDESQWSGTFVNYPFLHRTIMIAKKNGKMGIIDTANRTVLPFAYDGFFRALGWHDYPAQYFTVVINGKHGLIDITGKFIVPARYDHIMYSSGQYDKGIWLWANNRRTIADTNGNVVIDIPGYSADFPVDSFIPVTSLKGGSGLMNKKHEIVIPCLYAYVSVRHDSIDVLKDSIDAAGKHTWYRQFYNAKTIQPITVWLTDEQAYPQDYRKTPVKPAEPRRVNLSAAIALKMKTPAVLQKDSIAWFETGGSNSLTNGRYAIRGVAKDSTTYIAVVDTDGNFLFPPQRSKATIANINFHDSLLTLQQGKVDSFQCVTNYRLQPVLGYQRNVISTAFYYNKTFYAVVDMSPASNAFMGSRHYRPSHEQSGKRLVGSNGVPVKELENMGIISACNEYGENNPDNSFYTGFQLAEDSAFGGYFMAEDVNEAKGIIHLSGRVVAPAVSFKDNIFGPCGYGIFIVGHLVPYKYAHLYRANDKDEVSIKGTPYLVNMDGKVLLDSLKVSDVKKVYPIGGQQRLGQRPMPLLMVFLDNQKGYNYGSIMYMDYKGHGYYGKLPESRH